MPPFRFVCPTCSAQLAEVAGGLSCGRCVAHFPDRAGILRFVPDQGYAAGFGLQWHRHPRLQFDSFNGTTLSRDRFFQTTGWPRDLSGWRVLEAGCGSGRFTEVALEAGAEVCSFDLSRSVDACRANLGDHPRLTLFQGDLARIPLPEDTFDAIFCLGVLQHTPQPRESFCGLARHLKPGGRIAVDVYGAGVGAWLHPRRFLRPLVRGMHPERLYRLVAAAVPWLLPLGLPLSRLPGPLRHLARVVPVSLPPEELPPHLRREWSVLNTFDWLAPAHEHPQNPRAVHAWFEECGLEGIEVFRGLNGVCARGRRPA